MSISTEQICYRLIFLMGFQDFMVVGLVGVYDNDVVVGGPLTVVRGPSPVEYFKLAKKIFERCSIFG